MAETCDHRFHNTHGDLVECVDCGEPPAFFIAGGDALPDELVAVRETLAHYLPEDRADERARNIVQALTDPLTDVRDVVSDALVDNWCLAELDLVEPVLSRMVDDVSIAVETARGYRHVWVALPDLTGSSRPIRLSDLIRDNAECPLDPADLRALARAEVGEPVDLDIGGGAIRAIRVSP